IPAPDRLLSVQQASLNLAAAIDDGRDPIHAQKGVIIAGATNSGVYQSAIGLAGFEPAASCTRGRRSTKLSHSPNYTPCTQDQTGAHPISRITFTEARSNKRATQVASTKFYNLFVRESAVSLWRRPRQTKQASN